MAIGPPDPPRVSFTAVELVANLERRIDVWITDKWDTTNDAYPLPFWVLLAQNSDAFEQMLERYRKLWNFVEIIHKHNANCLQFRR